MKSVSVVESVLVMGSIIQFVERTWNLLVTRDQPTRDSVYISHRPFRLCPKELTYPSKMTHILNL